MTDQPLVSTPLTAKPKLTVGIVGAGAIGCFLGGILAQEPSLNVQFYGRKPFVVASQSLGISVQIDGQHFANPQPNCHCDLAKLAECDVILLTVKATAFTEILPQLAHSVRTEVPIVALQNGVGVMDAISAKLANPIYRAIVPFNVIKKTPAIFCKATSGALLWPDSQDEKLLLLQQTWQKFGLEVQPISDIKAVEYGKLLLNLNNALNALSDLPLQQQLLNGQLRRVLADAMAEWLLVCDALAVKPYRFAKVPVHWLPHILRAPTPLFRLLAKPMLAIAPDARSSMWDDFQAGRASEIHFLNGAVVRLGQQVGVATPINAAIVNYVQQIEEERKRDDAFLSMPPKQLVSFLRDQSFH